MIIPSLENVLEIPAPQVVSVIAWSNDRFGYLPIE
jgi:hypothetical protein